MKDAGLDVSEVLDVSAGEIPGGFQTEFMREKFTHVNFSLLVVAQKNPLSSTLYIPQMCVICKIT